MDLTQALAPLTTEEFIARWFGRKSFALVREHNPFADLLSIAEIEARLNDGCTPQSIVTVIDVSGKKLPPSEVYASPATWTAATLRKRRIFDWLREGRSLVMHNMSQINRAIAEFCASIESTFPGYHADLHIYLSPRAGASTFNVHRDNPQHKLYLQLVGTTSWTIYEGTDERVAMPVSEADKVLKVDLRTRLLPGSLIYMPPNVFHRVTADDGPRISLSFPFVEKPSLPATDRTHVPLRDFFA